MYLQKNDVNKLDLNYITNDKYKNIFELRKIKNNYLMNVMPKLVKNYLLINYEDLLFNYENCLDNIHNKFNLNKLNNLNNEYLKVNQYKKSDKYNFVQQRSITFTPQLINIIWNNLDIEQENKLGYYKYDDNNNFKNRNKIENSIEQRPVKYRAELMVITNRKKIINRKFPVFLK